MRMINDDELKQIQLTILDEVSQFCIEHKIKYWLDCGTLLGAVRHNGYIPWDDDIDLGMLRNDFDLFIHSFNGSEGGRYKVICNEIQKDCCYPYAKVIDTDTILFEPDEKGIKTSVNIDIFVYDVTPDEKSALEQYKLRDRYSFANGMQFGTFRFTKLYKRIIGGILSLFFRLFPKGYFAFKIVENSKKYISTNSKYIGNFTSVTNIFCDAGLLHSTILHEFEGKLYPIPIGYDAWLRAFYGDYMELPPEEERVTHHAFKAYIIAGEI